MKTIHSKLKQLRQRHQLTQVQIAHHLNCSIPAYSKMETGTTDVNTFRLGQIAKIYNIEIYEIFLIGEDVVEGFKDRIDRLCVELAAKSGEIQLLQRKLIKFYEDTHFGRAV